MSAAFRTLARNLPRAFFREISESLQANSRRATYFGNPQLTKWRRLTLNVLRRAIRFAIYQYTMVGGDFE